MSGQSRFNLIILVVVSAISIVLAGRIVAKRHSSVNAAQPRVSTAALHKNEKGDLYISGKELLDMRGTGTAYDIPSNVINSKKIEVFKPEGSTGADRQIAKAIAAQQPILVCFHDGSKTSSRVMALVGEVSASLPGMFKTVRVDFNSAEGRDLARRIQGVSSAPTIVALTQKGQIKTRLIGEVEKRHISEAYSKIVGCSDICEPGECE